MICSFLSNQLVALKMYKVNTFKMSDNEIWALCMHVTRARRHDYYVSYFMKISWGGVSDSGGLKFPIAYKLLRSRLMQDLS